jgi:hypothetical protein
MSDLGQTASVYRQIFPKASQKHDKSSPSRHKACASESALISQKQGGQKPISKTVPQE